MIFLVGCNKGGAGKTTTAINLSIALAVRGNEVCLVDADGQRSASKWHAEREREKLEPVITLIERQGNIAETLRTLKSKFQHLVVDVAGRNSRELISAAAVSDILIAPHQCSQLDLDTLGELRDQVVRIRDFNPELRAIAYHAMSSTNPVIKDVERHEFLKFMREFPEIEAAKSIGYFRKIYRDTISLGKSVLESENDLAAKEVNDLLDEVLNYD